MHAFITLPATCMLIRVPQKCEPLVGFLNFYGPSIPSNLEDLIIIYFLALCKCYISVSKLSRYFSILWVYFAMTYIYGNENKLY